MVPRFAVTAIQDFGTTNNGVTTVPISVKLGDLPAVANPVYEVISSLQLFSDLRIAGESRAADVLNAIYGGLRAPQGPVGPPQEHVLFSLGGKTLQLRPNQMHALQLGFLDLPVLVIQAAYGTGKTVVGALLAARIHSEQKAMVVATTTNTTVAQFTDTLHRLDDYIHLEVLRYVCDSALLERTPQTPVDIHTILKRFAKDYGHLMNKEALHLCKRYKRGRELLETHMFEPDRALYHTQQERDEYRMAERDVSDITADVVNIMFSVHPPAMVCLTTSALLNTVTAGGIFAEFLIGAQTVIGDEASQITEPAVVAITTRL